MSNTEDSEETDVFPLWARLLLGFFATLFGVVMILIAPTGQLRAIGYYTFGIFCLLITAACFTSGRVREFACSLIGCILFVAGAAYFVSELFWPDSSATTSIFGAVLFMFIAGIPGIMFAFSVRFGFHRPTNK